MLQSHAFLTTNTSQIFSLETKNQNRKDEQLQASRHEEFLRGKTKTKIKSKSKMVRPLSRSSNNNPNIPIEIRNDSRNGDNEIDYYLQRQQTSNVNIRPNSNTSNIITSNSTMRNGKSSKSKRGGSGLNGVRSLKINVGNNNNDNNNNNGSSGRNVKSAWLDVDSDSDQVNNNNDTSNTTIPTFLSNIIRPQSAHPQTKHINPIVSTNTKRPQTALPHTRTASQPRDMMITIAVTDSIFSSNKVKLLPSTAVTRTANQNQFETTTSIRNNRPFSSSSSSSPNRVRPSTDVNRINPANNTERPSTSSSNRIRIRPRTATAGNRISQINNPGKTRPSTSSPNRSNRLRPRPSTATATDRSTDRLRPQTSSDKSHNHIRNIRNAGENKVKVSHLYAFEMMKYETKRLFDLLDLNVHSSGRYMKGSLSLGDVNFDGDGKNNNRGSDMDLVLVKPHSHSHSLPSPSPSRTSDAAIDGDGSVIIGKDYGFGISSLDESSLTLTLPLPNNDNHHHHPPPHVNSSESKSKSESLTLTKSSIHVDEYEDDSDAEAAAFIDDDGDDDDDDNLDGNDKTDISEVIFKHEQLKMKKKNEHQSNNENENESEDKNKYDDDFESDKLNVDDTNPYADEEFEFEGEIEIEIDGEGDAKTPLQSNNANETYQDDFKVEVAPTPSKPETPIPIPIPPKATPKRLLVRTKSPLKKVQLSPTTYKSPQPHKTTTQPKTPPSPTHIHSKPKPKLQLVSLTPPQITHLLHSPLLPFPQYASLLQSKAVSGFDLCNCDENDLTGLGIGFRPHRLRLLKGVLGVRRVGVDFNVLDGGRMKIEKSRDAIGIASVNNSNSLSGAEYISTVVIQTAFRCHFTRSKYLKFIQLEDMKRTMTPVVIQIQRSYRRKRERRRVGAKWFFDEITENRWKAASRIQGSYRSKIQKRRIEERKHVSLLLHEALKDTLVYVKKAQKEKTAVLEEELRTERENMAKLNESLKLEIEKAKLAEKKAFDVNELYRVLNEQRIDEVNRIKAIEEDNAVLRVKLAAEAETKAEDEHTRISKIAEIEAERKAEEERNRLKQIAESEAEAENERLRQLQIQQDQFVLIQKEMESDSILAIQCKIRQCLAFREYNKRHVEKVEHDYQVEKVKEEEEERVNIELEVRRVEDERLAELEKVNIEIEEKRVEEDRWKKVESERLQVLEDERLAQIEAENTKLEDEHLAKIECERIEKLELDRLQTVEEERLAKLEQERLAKFELDRLQALEVECLAQVERERLAKLELDRQKAQEEQAEKTRLFNEKVEELKAKHASEDEAVAAEARRKSEESAAALRYLATQEFEDRKLLNTRQSPSKPNTTIESNGGEDTQDFSESGCGDYSESGGSGTFLTQHLVVRRNIVKEQLNLATGNSSSTSTSATIAAVAQEKKNPLDEFIYQCISTGITEEEADFSLKSLRERSRRLSRTLLSETQIKEEEKSQVGSPPELSHSPASSKRLQSGTVDVGNRSAKEIEIEKEEEVVENENEKVADDLALNLGLNLVLPEFKAKRVVENNSIVRAGGDDKVDTIRKSRFSLEQTSGDEVDDSDKVRKSRFSLEQTLDDEVDVDAKIREHRLSLEQVLDEVADDSNNDEGRKSRTNRFSLEQVLDDEVDDSDRIRENRFALEQTLDDEVGDSDKVRKNRFSLEQTLDDEVDDDDKSNTGNLELTFSLEQKLDEVVDDANSDLNAVDERRKSRTHRFSLEQTLDEVADDDDKSNTKNREQRFSLEQILDDADDDNNKNTASSIAESEWSLRRTKSKASVKDKEWVMYDDAERGIPFYYNVVTKDSTWSKPIGHVFIDDTPIKHQIPDTSADNNLAAKKEADAITAALSEVDSESKETWSLKRHQSVKTEKKGDWQCFSDPSTNSDFWYNNKTGESTWNKPDEFQTLRPAPPPEEFPPPITPAISQSSWEDKRQDSVREMTSAGWTKYKDPSSGLPFWHHESSGESSWDKPEDFIELNHERSGYDWESRRLNSVRKEGVGDWIEYNDPGTNTPFWHHQITGESTWEMPPSFRKEHAPRVGIGGRDGGKSGILALEEYLDDVATKIDVPATNVNMKMNADADANENVWETHVDPDTLRVYHFNTVTHESKWEDEKNDAFNAKDDVTTVNKLRSPSDVKSLIADPIPVRMRAARGSIEGRKGSIGGNPILSLRSRGVGGLSPKNAKDAKVRASEDGSVMSDSDSDSSYSLEMNDYGKIGTG